MNLERLQKVLAHAGVASRRQAEKMIAAGRVRVNGELIMEQGVKVGPKDAVEVDGQPIHKEAPQYFLFNKPTGVISAVRDDRNRPVVCDYFPEVEERIYPVGRLDYNTSGALIMTNDGEFAHLLMHPKFSIPKTYMVKVNGLVSDSDIKKLARGVPVLGRETAPAKAKLVKQDAGKGISVVALTLFEGRNRQVRRMIEAIGYEVNKLRRCQYGHLTVDNMPLGSYRVLTKGEVKRLKQMALEEDKK